MKRANMETVTANPKRRDFSDCFTWALLRDLARSWMNGRG
jgi:hypothetical protein